MYVWCFILCIHCLRTIITLLHMYTGKNLELILDEEGVFRIHFYFSFNFSNLNKISWSDTLPQEQSRIRTADFNQTAILTSLVIAFDGFFNLVNHTSGGKFLIIAQPFNKSWWSWLLNNLRFDRFMFIWILRCNNNLILWHVWKNQHLSLQIPSMGILHQGAHFIFFQINDNYFNKGTIKACV